MVENNHFIVSFVNIMALLVQVLRGEHIYSVYVIFVDLFTKKLAEYS